MKGSSNHPRRGAPALALLLAVLSGAAACADDSVTPTPIGETESTSSSSGLPPLDTTSTPGLDTTESASGGGSSSAGGLDSTGSSGSTGETEGTTGEPAVPGRTASQLVSSGTRTASRSYTLVHTLGQPSPLQSTHQSTSYRLQGGLVGANGSPP